MKFTTATLGNGAFFGALMFLAFCLGLFIASSTSRETPKCSGISSIVVGDTYDNCAKCSELARQIAWSLDHEPYLWRSDGFRLERDGGGILIKEETWTSVRMGRSMYDHESVISNDDKIMLWRAVNRWKETQK
jgi:hypothetical protein